MSIRMLTAVGAGVWLKAPGDCRVIMANGRLGSAPMSHEDTSSV